mgnify:FL=1
MKILTSNLMPPALNWLVAKLQGIEFTDEAQPYAHELMHFNYCTDWAQGGPIIEMERIELSFLGFDEIDEALPIWNACKYVRGVLNEKQGPTPLIAAMRCYVASKFGDEVDVPDELVGATA